MSVTAGAGAGEVAGGAGSCVGRGVGTGVGIDDGTGSGGNAGAGVLVGGVVGAGAGVGTLEVSEGAAHDNAVRSTAIAIKLTNLTNFNRLLPSFKIPWPPRFSEALLTPI
jgi:hypothetical protein